MASLSELRSALEWYADPAHYRPGTGPHDSDVEGSPEVAWDRGDRAREALAGTVSVVEYCAPAIGCERHRDVWLCRRCCHLGNRFVAWVDSEGISRGSWWAHIDYVEDLPDGEVLVEPGHADTLEAALELWDDMVAVMKSGRPPNPEWGN
jgi:hypothetical protein